MEDRGIAYLLLLTLIYCLIYASGVFQYIRNKFKYLIFTIKNLLK